jgi:hypothetical protein
MIPKFHDFKISRLTLKPEAKLTCNERLGKGKSVNVGKSKVNDEN